MPLKILHAADIHLGTHFPSLGAYAPERNQDFLKTFSKICETAVTEKVDLFFIAGDLFDSPHPSHEVFGWVQAELEKVIQNQIPIVIIPGTHDNIMASDHIFRHPFWDKTILFKDPILKDPKHLKIQGHDVYLYGMAYLPEVTTPYLENMKRRPMDGIHLGLMHGSVKDAPNWKIYEKDFPMTQDELFGLNLDYVALGHYHNPIVYEKNGIVRASYTGTPEGKRFIEAGPRVVHLITIQIPAFAGMTNHVELKPIPVHTKTMLEKEIDLFELAATENTVQKVKELQDPNTLLRLILKGTLEDVLDLSKIQGDLAPYFAYLEIIDETSVIDSQWIQRLEQENTIRGFFVRKMKEKINRIESEEEKEIYKNAFKEILQEFS